MRVLIVSQYFYPETFSINEIARALSNEGVDVEVLTGQPNYPTGRVFDGYRACSLKSDMFGSIPLHRVPLAPRGRGALGLFFNYISFVISACLFGPFKLRGKQFDRIFVYGVSPILAALPALLIGGMKGAPVIIWVLDLWPESLSATGYVKNKRLLGFVERIVRFIYRQSDHILVQSEAFVDEVKALAGPTPVTYYPNSVDARFLKPVARPETQLPHLEDKFIVLFAGNIGKAQAVETILEAAMQLSHKPDIHFVLVGDGRMAKFLRTQIEDRGLKNIELPGRFPLEQMPSFMNQASALLVTLTDETIFAKTVPNKIQAYLASGRPILASLNGEGARVVSTSGAGIAVGAEDATALSKAVLKLYEMTKIERDEMGKKGRAYFERHYNPNQLIQDLIDHLRTTKKPER